MNRLHRCHTFPEQSPGRFALLLPNVAIINIGQMFSSASFCRLDTYLICHNVANAHLSYVDLIIYKEITYSLFI
jgi:hypothetical protein